MPLAKPETAPGFISQATQVRARGAWFDGNLVRWRTTFLEKWGGWRRLVDQVMPAIVRRMHAWLDLDSRKNLLIATDVGVRLLVQETLYTLGRIIPLQGGYVPEVGVTGSETTFDVALNATEVTVNTGTPVKVGDPFAFLEPVSIGGRIIQPGSLFSVKALVGSGFKFDMLLPALSAETGAYGVPLLTNDAPNTMTVTMKNHGLTTGTLFRFPRTTSLKLGAAGVMEKVFIVIPGDTKVAVVVVDADHFNFNTGGPTALGSGDGTGGPDHQVFMGGNSEHATGTPIVASVGPVIGFTNEEAQINPQRQTWFLGNLGQDGLALAAGGPLEVYKSPITNGPFLTPVGVGPPATAPQKSNGFIVAMPQAQVILFGSEISQAGATPGTQVFGAGVIDPLLVRWSDVGTYDEYQLSVSNQAGSFRLSRGSRIVGMIQAPQTTLIMTDTDLWQMSYIGPPLIYGFTIMGSGCGLVAPHAIGIQGRTTIWQGQKNFWQFGDTAVQVVPCSVWDYIFTDIDPLNVNKCHAAPNSTTNELAFYFPSKKTVVDLAINLLRFSQDFQSAAWAPINVTVTHLSTFLNRYLYEPMYLQSGWYDEGGLAPISWLDQDLGGVLENRILAPDTTDTALALVDVAVNDTHSIWQTVDKPPERITYTFSLYVHQSSTRNLTLWVANGFGSAFATFDPAAGNVLAAGAGSPKFALVSARMMIDELGTGVNGWRRYVLTFTSDDSGTLAVFISNTNGTALSYLGEPPKHLLIWGAQMVEGGDPLTYEKTEGLPVQNETRRYVKVNTAEGMAWDSGKIGRSAWLDESIWGPPLGADITPIGPPRPDEKMKDDDVIPPPRNLIQQHEIGYDDDGQPMVGVFAETGYTELGDGTALMLIDQVHPDLKWFGINGGVKLSIRATNYPQGPNHLYGPFSMTPGTQWFNPRVRTRYAAIRYDWEPRLGFSARVGLTTFHIKPAGRLP